MKEQNRVPRVLLALLSVLLAACGGEGSQAFNLGGPERALPAMRLEPLWLESLERWDLLPGNTPLLKSEDTACQDNSCWLLHNDGTRMVRLFGQRTGKGQGIGIIESRDIDGRWHRIGEPRNCSQLTSIFQFDEGSEMADLPVGGTRLLGEISCRREPWTEPDSLPTGTYRFLLPLVVEVDGVSRLGFIARHFVVQPAPSVERERLRALLADPRTVACHKETTVVRILRHGIDNRSMRALLFSEQVPSAPHDTLLKELSSNSEYEAMLTELMTRRESPLGLRYAMSLRPHSNLVRDPTRDDAALSQLLHAFFSGPPDDELVIALAHWNEAWPDTVLPRLVGLLEQDPDDSLHRSVQYAIEIAIERSTDHRAQVSALLAQRCQAPQRCADDAGGHSVAQFLQEALQEELEEDAELIRIHRQAPVQRMHERSVRLPEPEGACAALTRELEEYGRFVAGIPLDVELGETEMQLCDSAPPNADRMRYMWETGCHRVVDEWERNLRVQQITRVEDAAIPKGVVETSGEGSDEGSDEE